TSITAPIKAGTIKRSIEAAASRTCVEPAASRTRVEPAVINPRITAIALARVDDNRRASKSRVSYERVAKRLNRRVRNGNGNCLGKRGARHIQVPMSRQPDELIRAGDDRHQARRRQALLELCNPCSQARRVRVALEKVPVDARYEPAISFRAIDNGQGHRRSGDSLLEVLAPQVEANEVWGAASSFTTSEQPDVTKTTGC